MPPAAIPPEFASRAAWWRSATAGQRHAILLDNAHSAAQARALLPGAGRHVVVVTSRRRLGGLVMDGARYLHLGPLSVPDAAQLLRLISDDLGAHTDVPATERVAFLCGGLPIAVSSVAVQAASGRPLLAVAADLEGRRRRLSVLSGEEVSVQAAFDLSYDALDADTRLAYRRLAWHPGADFSVEVAQALTGLEAEVSERALTALVAASLLTEVEGRYRFHDLIALHALTMARRHEPEGERVAALHRLCVAYAEWARAADHVLRPYVANRGPGHGPFAAPDEALAWLVRERDALLACADHAAHGEDSASAVGIAEGMWPLYLHHRDAANWLRACEPALRVTSDQRTRARLLSKRGLAHGFLHQLDAADRAFTESETTWRQLGDRWRQSQVRQRRGLLALGLDDHQTAITHLTTALTIHDDVDKPHDRAITLLGLGRALIATDQGPRARPPLREAVDLLEATQDANHLSRARVALARATMDADSQDAKAKLCTELAVLRQRGSMLGRAEAHEALGDLATHQGRTSEAAEHYQAAIQLLRTMGSQAPATRIEQRLLHLGR
ncbi:hypothetical protein J4H86_24560 [Spiractinospora alimapuensis]|uniref:hypothetical protein n=1 Tax=Spiractinospora alimapuensis TaxID=2820884 RepID=UPI001F397DA5|nr:hypothetical protein [Spiractinospora alimapuensis]QVQ51891.1 hypothetical protein J4H86_24560 [Spiractinospora alimapuensis]